MIDLGWTQTEFKKCVNLLYSEHSIKIIVRLMDTSHNYIDDLSNRFLDGTVTVDADATEADRALDLTLLDPLRSIQLDPDSPASSGLFITTMISIIYQVSSPDGATVFNIPVFTGPIDDVSRTDVTLSIKCLGKEVLASDTLWVGRTFKKGLTFTGIIRQILGDAGENKMNIPSLKATTKSRVSLKRGEHKPWVRSQTLARSQGLQLFYDGRGVATTRPTAKWSILGCDKRNITGDGIPQFGYDLKSCSNVVEVTGGVPKGRKHPVYYKAVAPSNHPLSPMRVGRNGQPRYLNPIFVSDDSLKTTAQVKAMARSLLADALLEATEASLNILPNPLLEPLDVLHIVYGGMSIDHRVRKFTLPLKNGSNMTVGYNSRSKTRGKPAITKKRK
jgi:hypothetical protein